MCLSRLKYFQNRRLMKQYYVDSLGGNLASQQKMMLLYFIAQTGRTVNSFYLQFD